MLIPMFIQSFALCF